MLPNPQAKRVLLGGFGWALLAILLGGYRFGVADHGIHLPLLDMVLHPERWRGDLLVLAADAHATWFGHLQAPFVEWLGAAPWTAALYLAVLVATGAALGTLASTAGLSPVAAGVAAALLAWSYRAPGGAPTLDPLLLHRTVALPLELAGLALLLRGRVAAAFLAVGLAVCLHAPSAVALAFGMAFGHAVLLRERADEAGGVGGAGLREVATALAAPALGFALGAAPLVVPWMLRGGPSGSLARVDDAWWAALAARVPHHLMPGSWGLEVWGGGAAWLGLLGVSVLALVRFGGGLGAEVRALVAVATGCLVWAVSVGSVAGPVTRIALALQLEAWQATRFVIVVAVVLSVAALAKAMEGGRRGWVAALGICLAATLLTQRSGEERAFQPAGPADAEAEVARWAAAHSEEGDVFLVPPARFGAFRALAGRPAVVTWKDGGEATFSRELAVEWVRRAERVCACAAVESGAGGSGDGAARGGLAALRQRLARGWAARGMEDIRQTALGEGAHWIVVERERADAAPVFEAGPWAVLRASEVSLRAP